MARTTKEKAKLLGSRVFNKHRKMLAELEKILRLPSEAEVVRRAIEEMYERNHATIKRT